MHEALPPAVPTLSVRVELSVPGEPTAIGSRSPSSSSVAILLRFFRRFLAYRTSLLLGLLCIPLAQLCDVGITLLVGDALDRAQDASDTEWMTRVLLLMGAYAVGHSVMRFYQR